jgi:hypothetical protein
MNRFHLLIFFLLASISLLAQDTIIKYNGEIVYAKVFEVSPSEIKYKRFAEGPVYIENKSEIRAIKYSNGFKEEFKRENYLINEDYRIADKRNLPSEISLNSYYKIEPFGSRYRYRNSFISENSLHSILLKSNNKEINKLVRKSKDAHGLQFIGFGAIPLGIAAIYFLQNSGFQPFYDNGNRNNGDIALAVVCFAGAIACPIGSGIFKHKRKEANSRAIDLYNSQY